MRWGMIVIMLLCLSSDLNGQETPNVAREEWAASIEREVRGFLAIYEEDLQRHRKQDIAARYDSRGVFFLGHGKKEFETFEENQDYYLTSWRGPESFEWQDLTIEVLSRDAAVVFGKFDWGIEDGNVATISYTALLVRRDGQWRIRAEAESGKCP